MAHTQYNIYECENPDCRLRFPGAEGALRWNRCPACRGRVRVVATVEPSGADVDRKTISPKPRVGVMLDNLRSAWNVGSILRTSDGLGIDKIYLCGISPSPDHPKVSKTALGAELSIPWVHSRNGVRKAQELKSEGKVLWALEGIPTAIPLYQVEPPDDSTPLVLIVGNEMSGVDPGILELCNRVISIPMLGQKRSYNVAIAFAIAASFLMYRLTIGLVALPPQDDSAGGAA